MPTPTNTLVAAAAVVVGFAVGFAWGALVGAQLEYDTWATSTQHNRRRR